MPTSEDFGLIVVAFGTQCSFKRGVYLLNGLLTALYYKIGKFREFFVLS